MLRDREFWSTVAGALTAGLLIAGVFLGIFAAVIALLCLIA